MRLEDFLNQTTVTKRLTQYQKQPEAAAFSLPRAQDTVSISPEAKEAQRSGGSSTNNEVEVNEARAAFKSYMDQVTGRVPQAPKTPEEKIKELNEKLKKLQGTSKNRGDMLK